MVCRHSSALSVCFNDYNVMIRVFKGVLQNPQVHKERVFGKKNRKCVGENAFVWLSFGGTSYDIVTGLFD